MQYNPLTWWQIQFQSRPSSLTSRHAVEQYSSIFMNKTFINSDVIFAFVHTQNIALMKSPFHYFSVGAICEFCQNLWKSLISEWRIYDAIFTSLDDTSPRKLRKTVKTTHYTLSAKRNLSLRRSDTQENPKHQNESYLDTD